MSVYKPKQSAYYHYDFVHKGRRFHGSTGVENKAAAKNYERRVRVDAAEGRLGDGAQLTIDQAVARWWSEVGQHHTHSERLAKRLDVLVKVMGADTVLAEIDQTAVAEAIERRRGMLYRRGNGPDAKQYVSGNTTVNNDVIDRLRPILRRAATHWNAQGLPSIDWKAMRLSEPRETVKVYATAEQDRWLAEAERTGWRNDKPTFRAADVRLALEMLLTYGLRFSELFFAPDAVDLEREQGARLYWLKGRKGDVPMTVPLIGDHPRQIAARVGRAKAAGLPHIWFYEYSRGKNLKLIPISPAGLESRLSAAADRAGVSAGRRMHGARHHVGTKIYHLTRDMKLTQKLLGHADIKSTMRYVHADDTMVRAALETMLSVETTAAKAKSTGGGGV